MNKIIFGGGFDPIHLGHINMALMAQKVYGGEVIFVPAKVAIWKSSSINQEHKLAMLKLAIKDYPFFSVDTFELDQDEQPRSYQTVEYFKKKYPNENIYYVTRYADTVYSSFDFSDPVKDVFVMFGRESTGIDKEILSAHKETTLRIPMMSTARSLNLSNCAAIMLFLASEAINPKDVVFLNEPDTLKGENFIENLDVSKLDYKHREGK